MAFFGLTHLGYQNPIGDKMIVNPKGTSQAENDDVRSRAGLPPSPSLQEPLRPLGCTDMRRVSNQPLPYSSSIHHRSQERYKEMVKRGQTPRSPNQLYVMPLTDSQQYGWLTSKEKSEPWTQVERFPHKRSDVTKYVEEMLKTDPEFSLL
ncbi:sperm microtubule inner protein 11 [Genypterus blacodes]|uniref:sperm microtubule inner protein 11 n=1 Tax=Genypterus blacodes TaxID=154954 RepID=UPI003F77218D